MNYSVSRRGPGSRTHRLPGLLSPLWGLGKNDQTEGARGCPGDLSCSFSFPYCRDAFPCTLLTSIKKSSLLFVALEKCILWDRVRAVCEGGGRTGHRTTQRPPCTRWGAVVRSLLQ